jgi:hypothetical protein
VREASALRSSGFSLCTSILNGENLTNGMTGSTPVIGHESNDNNVNDLKRRVRGSNQNGIMAVDGPYRRRLGLAPRRWQFESLEILCTCFCVLQIRSCRSQFQPRADPSRRTERNLRAAFMELSFAIVALLFAAGDLARVKPTTQLFRFNCGGSFERGFFGRRTNRVATPHQSRPYRARCPSLRAGETDGMPNRN